jgi:predicted amidophosphoribosyltransferase
MLCPGCQQENPAAQKFCGECGGPLQTASPSSPPALVVSGYHEGSHGDPGTTRGDKRDPPCD